MIETNNLAIDIKAITNQLLQLIGSNAHVSVTMKDDSYLVKINTEEEGILIGYHGETLAALQLIIAQAVTKKTGSWPRLIVTIGDYIEKRQQKLEQIADVVVEHVCQTGKPEALPYLSPRERRHIHVYLDGVKSVRTESVGEGKERRLVVFPTH